MKRFYCTKIPEKRFSLALVTISFLRMPEILYGLCAETGYIEARL